MRVRTFREEDLPALLQIQDVVARADGREPLSERAFTAWLQDPVLDACSNAFVITDDDDELNTWGQAGTLEGIEGEIVGYTVLQLHRDQDGYHLPCHGAVHPLHRGRGAGRALLICAANRAQMVAAALSFEVAHEEPPFFFEALLPSNDPRSARLAERCEMQATDEPARDGLLLYRREL